MQGRVECLETDAIRLIHEKSLQLLEEVGFKLDDPDLVGRLKNCEVNIDEHNKNVRIPKKVSEYFLSKIPHNILLYAVDPRCDIEMGKKRLYRPISGTIYMLDNGDRVRKSSLNDMRNIAKIVQKLDLMSFNSTAVLPFDVPNEVRDIAAARVCFEVCSKHVLVDTLSRKSFEAILEMAFAIAGGEEAFKKRPFFQVHFPVVSPLVFDRNACECVKLAAEYRIPVRIGTSPMSGANGPVRLAGTLLLTHTEVLAAAIVTQMLQEGCPVYQGTDPAIFDMRYSTMSWGSAEHAKMSARCCELGHYSKLYVSINGFATDSKLADTQSVLEKSIDVLTAALSGADIIGGAGLLEGELTYDVAQLVIDNEIALYVENVLRDIEINEESLSVDLVKEVGIGGNYLETDQTLRFFRTEHVESVLQDRRSRGAWEGINERTMYDKAKKVAADLIMSSDTYVLSDKTRGELEKIYARNL
jgi:trimethylamine--corrinoid protein Co-methyltransferase